MPRPTGPTNPGTQRLVKKMKKEKQALIARHLAKPRRAKRAVNVGSLNKIWKGEPIAVPGKVLSLGNVDKAMMIYAEQFSKEAKNKIERAGGKALLLGSLKAGEKVSVVV